MWGLGLRIWGLGFGDFWRRNTGRSAQQVSDNTLTGSVTLRERYFKVLMFRIRGTWVLITPSSIVSLLITYLEDF